MSSNVISVLDFDYGTDNERLEILSTLLSDQFSGIILTSATAMKAYDMIIQTSYDTHDSQLRLEKINSFQKLPCYCVGKATQRAAISRGFENVITPVDPTGNAITLTAFLSQLVAGRKEGQITPESFDFTKPLLVLTCPQRLPTLSTRLSQFQIPFVEHFIYSSKPKSVHQLTEDLRTSFREYDLLQKRVILSFFSPSGVTAIHETMTYNIEKTSNPLTFQLTPEEISHLQQAPKISIGQTTENIILKYSQQPMPVFAWKSSGSADTPTPEGLLQIILKFIQVHG